MQQPSVPRRPTIVQRPNEQRSARASMADSVPRPLLSLLLVTSFGCVPTERSEGAVKGTGSAAASPSGTLRAHAPRAGTSVARPSERPGANDAEGSALPILTHRFQDDFERSELGEDYLATSTAYRIEQGRLCVKGARNHPLWLRPRLPENARIEVDAQTSASDGDIKLEAWGDGRSAATAAAYDNASSYIAIFGGWKNRYHVLARLDEHAPGRPEVVIEPGSDDPRQQPVLADKRYRLRLERGDGRTVRFWVDDVELVSFSDPVPLTGDGHEYFAFNNWQTPVCFDNLVVEPLAG